MTTDDQPPSSREALLEILNGLADTHEYNPVRIQLNVDRNRAAPASPYDIFCQVVHSNWAQLPKPHSPLDFVGLVVTRVAVHTPQVSKAHPTSLFLESIARIRGFNGELFWDFGKRKTIWWSPETRDQALLEALRKIADPPGLPSQE